jgi:hypothetical protein
MPSRGRTNLREEVYSTSEVKTYAAPWMWSWWTVRPSELMSYPEEEVPIEPLASRSGKKDRSSEPEMFAWALRKSRQPRQVKGTLLR